MAGRPLPRMMIGFLVRRCVVDLGREPSPAEFARWANQQGSPQEPHRLFGRPINEAEARVILRHRGRVVTARGAAAHEQWQEPDEGVPTTDNIVSLDAFRARRRPG